MSKFGKDGQIRKKIMLLQQGEMILCLMKIYRVATWCLHVQTLQAGKHTYKIIKTENKSAITDRCVLKDYTE